MCDSTTFLGGTEFVCVEREPEPHIHHFRSKREAHRGHKMDENEKAIRDRIASDLTKLLDTEGVAKEWNAAIEQAIQVVEGVKA